MGIQRWTAVPFAYTRAFFSSFRGKKVSGRAALAMNEYLVGRSPVGGVVSASLLPKAIVRSPEDYGRRSANERSNRSTRSVNAFAGSEESNRQAVRAALLGVAICRNGIRPLASTTKKLSFLKRQDDALSVRAAGNLSNVADVLSPRFENGAVRAQSSSISDWRPHPPQTFFGKSFDLPLSVVGSLAGLFCQCLISYRGVVTELARCGLYSWG
jgi:hypothetical protein